MNTNTKSIPTSDNDIENPNVKKYGCLEKISTKCNTCENPCNSCELPYKKCNFERCNRELLNKFCSIIGWIVTLTIIYIILTIAISSNKSDNHPNYNNSKIEHEKHKNYNYIWRHYYKNPPSLSELHSDTYHWKKHYRKKCSDFDYGCCKIYDGGHKYTLDINRVIPYNKDHINCPTYGDLIYNYNLWRENYYSKNETDCSIQKCCTLNIYEDELKNNRNPSLNISDYDITIKFPVQPHSEDPFAKRCPDIYDIWYEYELDRYSDPFGFPWGWLIVGIIIVGLAIKAS